MFSRHRGAVAGSRPAPQWRVRSSHLPYGIVSDRHPLRTLIIGTLIGTLLANFLFEPVRHFFAGAWHVVIVVASAVWTGLSASVPVWALLAVGAIAALVTRWASRGSPAAASGVKVYDTTTRTLKDPAAVAPSEKVYDTATGTLKSPVPLALPILTDLGEALLRELALADGAPIRVGDFATTLGTTQLRVSKALEDLEQAELVTHHRSYMDGTAYGLTMRGRDVVIERKWA